MGRRHYVDIVQGELPVRVEMGYDRPLKNFYMQIWRCDAASPTSPPEAEESHESDDEALDDEQSDAEGLLYASIWDYEPFVGEGIECFRETLQGLDILVPESMLEEVTRDATRGATVNELVAHQMNESPLTDPDAPTP